MTRKEMSRREIVTAGLAGVLAAGIGAGRAAGAPGPTLSAPDDEFIRVAPDHWSFESARTRRRFVPFGSNLVLTSKEDLNIFGPRYTAERYDRILAACEALHINLLKVFLPLSSVLPDPQTPGEARIAPGYLDNLMGFLDLCSRHHIRAVVSLAEWGGSTLQWWAEGGEYFGRRPWKTDPGIDSLEVLCRFWQIVGARLRDHPAVFSYTPIVEWSMPDTNLTGPWSPRPEDIGLLKSDTSVWYWRRWLLAKYRTVELLNTTWGTAYRSIDETPIVDFTYDFSRHAYADPDAKVLDYQNFKEWASLRYFSPQVAAIRAVDPNHMVTISNHMRHWDLWEGAAKYFLADTAAEQKRMVDYVTHHANYDEDTLKGGRTISDIVHELEIQARFSHAGKPTPVIIEEFTFAAADPKRNAEGQAAMVRGTVGHASGWTTWYLQYPEGSNEADTSHRSAWLNADLTPTAWGETARALHEELMGRDLRRTAPHRVIKLDRAVELVAKSAGTIVTLRDGYAKYPHPTDFEITHEPDLDIRLPGDPPSGRPITR